MGSHRTMLQGGAIVVAALVMHPAAAPALTEWQVVGDLVADTEEAETIVIERETRFFENRIVILEVEQEPTPVSALDLLGDDVMIYVVRDERRAPRIAGRALSD